jgi:hypothetical protein
MVESWPAITSDRFLRPFAGMTRIRFKGCSRQCNAISASFPPAPLGWAML